jgi:hypothetical protein
MSRRGASGDERLDQAIGEMLEPANWPGFDDFAKLGL